MSCKKRNSSVLYKNERDSPLRGTHLPMQETKDAGSIPGWGRPPGGWHDNSLQLSSCLENPMDGGTWKATVHGVAKSHT